MANNETYLDRNCALAICVRKSSCRLLLLLATCTWLPYLLNLDKILALKSITIACYELIWLKLVRCMLQLNTDLLNPRFFKTPSKSNHKSFTILANTILLISISRTNFRFPWKFEKSLFYCITWFMASSVIIEYSRLNWLISAAEKKSVFELFLKLILKRKKVVTWARY